MATFSKRVAASADDGRKDPNFSPAWDYTGTSLKTGAESIPTRSITAAVRFNAVTIPNGSTVSSATITFTASFNDSNNVLTKVYGIDEDDTADFSSDPTGRTKTTASSDWDQNGVTAESTYNATVTSQVQEIIDRAGWSSGNDMGFLIENDGSSAGNIHFFYAYDGSTTKAALLSVTYTPPATTTSTSSTSTSSSTTTTTSSSTSSSTTTTSTSTTITPEIDFGIRLSKIGFEATSSNPNDFLLWSKYPQLQVLQTNQFSRAFVNDGYVDYYHGLNYKPFALGFLQWYDGVSDTISSDFRLLDWSIEGAGYSHYSRMEITKNKLRFYVYDSLLDKQVTLKGYYIIFRNPLDEVYNVRLSS